MSGGPVDSLHRISARELGTLLGDWRSGAGRRPGYELLAERIRQLVLDGRLAVGEVLPSERALAELLSVSRTTTTAAYRLLRDTGYAEGRHGSGTLTSLPTGRHNGRTKLHEVGRPGGPWPVSLDDSTSPTTHELSFAAPNAPPQLYSAAAAALTALPRYLASSGYVTPGLPVLREAVAERFAVRGLPTSPDQILITSGATQADDILAEYLVRRGDRVLVEDPTWPVIPQHIKAAGGRLICWNMDDGWELERLQRIAQEQAPAVAVIGPDFHNPTGRLMPESLREPMVAALTGTGCRIVVDETMVEIDLRGFNDGARRAPTPLPPIAALDPAVITIGSASKIFWGGLRIGWIRADPATIATLTTRRATRDLAGSLIDQLVVAELLAEIDDVRTERLATLGHQRQVALDALHRLLPSWQSPETDGGHSLWVRLPSPHSTALAATARRFGLEINSGPRFSSGGIGALPRDVSESRLRVPFARSPEQISTSISLLAAAWHSLDRNATSPVPHRLIV